MGIGMISLDLQVIAMAPVEDSEGKRWVYHAKKGEKRYRITLRMGDDQYQIQEVELNTPSMSDSNMQRITLDAGG
jgi:hypothetical protein